MEDVLKLRVRAVTFGDADIRQLRQKPARLVEGPVEGRVTDTLGLLVEGTRLFGYVWTADPEVVIRYHEAELPSGQRLPVCIVALESFGGLEKLPGSSRKVALVQDNGVALRIVDVFP